MSSQGGETFPEEASTVRPVAYLTGQELTKMALAKLADGSPAKLVRVLRMSEFTDTVEPAKSIGR